MIAQTTIYGQRPNEERFKIIVEIGLPYQVENAWACPVSVQPLQREIDIYGDNSLQALCLAIGLALELVSDFKQKGGKLQHITGEEFQFKPYAFGIVAAK